MPDTLNFYEKPGCINNTRQKKILRDAGVEVTEYSLLTKVWDKNELRTFFADRPVAEWFNPSAPMVKEKKIRPAECHADDALNAMLKDPLLIRRPLIQIGQWRTAGFDWPLLQKKLGIAAAIAGDIDVPPGIEACAHQQHDRQGDSV